MATVWNSTVLDKAGEYMLPRRIRNFMGIPDLSN